MATRRRPAFSQIFQTFGGLWKASARLTVMLAMDSAPLVMDRSLQRRAAVRYRLRLPVIFHWNDGKDHTEGGFTADVALDGAFILSSKCPPMGTSVRIEILLPTPDQSGGELRIECIGKVMRVVSQAGITGFGVQGVFDDDHLTGQTPE